MAQAKKGLGRGLSALIPTDMDFLAEVARGDFSVLAPASPPDASRQLPVEPGPPGVVSRETPAESAAEEATIKARGASLIGDSPLGAHVANVAPLRQPRPSSSMGLEPDGAGSAVAPSMDAVLWVGPQQIEANPYQPRRSFDEAELGSLADSIREHGVLQPIIVRPIALGWGFGLDAEQTSVRFQLIAGERRWRAAQAAGLETVPVIVREVSDQQALELAIIENVQRHDISALDAAVAYKRLSQEFGLSQEKIARRVGKSRPSIANTLRLLDLPSEAQQAIQDGALSEGHGRAILLAPGPNDRRAVLRAILRGKLSVRQAEEMAGRIARQAQREASAGGGAQQEELRASRPGGLLPGEDRNSCPRAASESDTPDGEHSGHDSKQDSGHQEDAVLIEQMQRALSCRVQVKRRRSGGQIVLFAADDHQLERLAAALAAT